MSDMNPITTFIQCLGRRTEEGYAIYKEDELGIDIEAGGTLSA
jgi:hypothetical protein